MAELRDNGEAPPSVIVPGSADNGLRRRARPVHLQRLGGRLDPVQMEFVQSIRRKDVSGVLATLQDNPNQKLYQLEDLYGVSALEHAVLSGSVEILDKLFAKCNTMIERNQAIERAMLFTIKENNVELMDWLIGLHKATGLCLQVEDSSAASSVKKEDKVSSNDINIEMGKTGLRQSTTVDLYWEDAEFSQDIKPMVLAAQLERSEIIDMLHTRCCPTIHPITADHPTCIYGGDCYICGEYTTSIGRQSIEDCRRVIEVYKALSSPAYMFSAGVEDPVLEAFVIADFMERRHIVDPAFRDEYKQISRRCQRFATDLLGLCRTTKEVHTLFGVEAGIKETHRTQFHVARFPRLLVAIHFNQKDFVAHPNCQQVMQSYWYSGLPDWVCQTHHHYFRMTAYVLALAVLMPIIFGLYMFRVTYVEKFVKPAANKFIFDSISFILFLFMLFIKVSLAGKHVRGGNLDALEWIIFIWVIGLTVRYVKMSFRRRDRFWTWVNVENSNWRFYELIMIASFWLHYILAFVVMGIAHAKNEVGMDRCEWEPLDPYLWAEAFFALANILTVVQVYSFFKVSSVLGPLQVSLKKMVFDVSKFLILFIVVLSAFAIGMTFLYTGYADYSFTNKAGEVETQKNTFSTLGNAYKRLFWDLFGYGEEENADLVDILGGNASVPSCQNKTNTHRMTEIVGYTFYAAYQITVIVVLLNMLIAMMANSYNNIEANADTEWKFARTRLFMNYFNEVGVTCTPFNLIPTRPLLALLGKRFYFCRYFKKRPSMQHQQMHYKHLLERLNKRYWKMRRARTKKQNAEGSTPSEKPTRPDRRTPKDVKLQNLKAPRVLISGNVQSSSST